MPPNLGGFFMVRSYYPSECHADYFDFERIEALKPAIEACGISTLSQSPMLGFHKQMDNRIKLLEEILSFRMQGVEFDNGDMYVDGHKAASDVRDEFVSVNEKLMDELAQCYNVLPQLDINNTIDHRPEGDEKWFLENEKTVTQFCRKLAAERPLKDIRDEYNYPKKKGIKDECSRFFVSSTRRQTRCSRDWSSDVCSSDLLLSPLIPRPAQFSPPTPQATRFLSWTASRILLKRSRPWVFPARPRLAWPSISSRIWRSLWTRRTCVFCSSPCRTEGRRPLARRFQGPRSRRWPFAIAEREARRLYFDVSSAFVLPAGGAGKSLGLAGGALPCSRFSNRLKE